ncbi:ParB/RepB/Spo0J family partition protein [Dictyobacter formicarum]|uniref:ParB-like N-terminal domain-containing protein n=1 Tax=Dictyobacter formicarum TaxID=2778368 RepID=A0ABQ3VPR4_9CHLR|nr:ParB/RepB/Spo0J family partition protein [Dictyobacter formicarum]GHO88242.1 hypothetical protein KSZ_62480 [Dictyobacter formicarum]
MTQNPKNPFKARRTGPAVQDPSVTLREHGIHGSRESVGAVQPVARRLTVVPIERIRPSRYQKREHLDPQTYEQLKDQIRDLGFQFTAVLCQDPDDERFYNLMMGGHIRIQAAKELGIQEVQAVIKDYDRLQLAKGTYFENNGRQPLTLMEEGLTFRQLQEDEGWSQERIASELKVSRSHVSLCMLAAESAPDIQDMLKADPSRGQRCFYYLRQLDELGGEKAAALRAPIIQKFLDGEISTDQVKHLVEQILQNEKSGKSEPISIESAQGKEKVVSALKSFQRYEKVLGDRVPSQSEREELETIKERIEAILARS